VARSGVRDSWSIKPRLRNANLLITHVLDSCVRLLAVLHISSAHTGSIHEPLCGNRKGWRKMTDMISILGPLVVVQYGT